jgi:hypothetical protein
MRGNKAYSAQDARKRVTVAKVVILKGSRCPKAGEYPNPGHLKGSKMPETRRISQPWSS